MRSGRVVATVAALWAAAVLGAAPACADPNPCASVPFGLCQLVPIFPDLDHDIDLTQNPDGTPVSLVPDPQGPTPAQPPLGN